MLSNAMVKLNIHTRNCNFAPHPLLLVGILSSEPHFYNVYRVYLSPYPRLCQVVKSKGCYACFQFCCRAAGKWNWRRAAALAVEIQRLHRTDAFSGNWGLETVWALGIIYRTCGTQDHYHGVLVIYNLAAHLNSGSQAWHLQAPRGAA